MFTTSFKAVINAGVPAVQVVTHEWERAMNDINVIAQGTGIKVAQWNYVDGLFFYPANGRKTVVRGIDESKNVSVLTEGGISELIPLGDFMDINFDNPTEIVPGNLVENRGDGWYKNTICRPQPNLVPVFLEIEKLKDTVVVFFNFGGHLKVPAVLQMVRNFLSTAKVVGVTLVFLSVTNDIPPELEKEVIVIDYDLPSREAIESILGSFANIEVKGEARNKIVDAALGLTQNEAENIMALSLVRNNMVLDEEAVNMVKKEKAQAIKKLGVLELSEPENLPKVGGLDVLKMWLWERSKAFTPEAREYGLPNPKGMLVFGIPGTGKSLIAKTIAKQWDMPLLVMGNVLDKFVGESERKIKEALKQAEGMAPCVLMVDELEKFFAGSSGSSDSGVSSRVFGIFLSWIQETKKPVFVVGTANNIGALPPELLRKGRFDEIFFVDLPNLMEREEIFRIHIVRKNRDPENFDLSALARATAGYTGSEVEQVVIAGMFRAFSRDKDIDTDVLLEVAKETSPLSSTMQEQIAAMRDWGKKRARLASSVESEKPLGEHFHNAHNVNRLIRGN